MTTSKDRVRVAFLLSQVGAAAAQRFAERLGDLHLTPSDVGILRVVAGDHELSQRALADRLGVAPSRVVVLLDRLEKHGLVERVRSVRDRRHHELALTNAGREVMAAMRDIGREHEREITSALTADERDQLGALLTRIADSLGLTPDVHPGYRNGSLSPGG